MKIVHLVAGAGQMYCGSCLYGSRLAAALREAGEEVVLAPVYTPLRTERRNLGRSRVVFGGVNAYLQQHAALFRHTPWFLDRILDSPWLLRWLGRRAGSTQPRKLGPMTVSMLRGEEGRQRKELDKLLAWLEEEGRPDVVHLSNVMLVGTARLIHRRLGAAVVCTLSGADVFLEELIEPYHAQARAELSARCTELDALVALNGYYADFMAEYLPVPRERIHVISPGLDLEGYESRPQAARSGASDERPATIGYFSRICPEKGLHVLVEAFRLLARDEACPPARLHAAGYLGPSDRPYLKQIGRQLDQWGLGDRFEYLGEPDRPGKIAMLQSLDVLSVPTVHPQSKGLAVLEGLAAGTPVVLPDHGAFSEMVRETGGGLLYWPNTPQTLAEKLKQMLLDPALATRCGQQAAQAIHEKHDTRQMAQRTIELYRQIVSAAGRAG